MVMASALMAQDKPTDVPQSLAAKEVITRHQAALVAAQQAYIQSLIQADLLELTDLDTAAKAAMQKYQLDEANRIKAEQDRADVTFNEHKNWVTQGLPLATAHPSFPTTVPVPAPAPLAPSNSAPAAPVVLWTKTFEISARERWQTTLDVQQGQHYRITAAGKWVHSPRPQDITGPDGAAVGEDQLQWFRAGRAAYLEGRIRGGLPFGVGSFYELVPLHNGSLEMEMADNDYSDNSGSLQVRIELMGSSNGSSQPPASPETPDAVSAPAPDSNRVFLQPPP
jgi:hypothetical protein